MNLGFFEIVLLPLILLIAAAIFCKGPWRRFLQIVLVASFLTVLVLVVLSLFFSVRQVPVVESIPQNYSESAWLDLAEPEFPADVYPSVSLALKGLIGSLGSYVNSPRDINIYIEKSSALEPTMLIEETVDSAVRAWDNARQVHTFERLPSPADDSLMLDVAVSEYDGEAGTLCLHLLGGGTDVTVSTRFVNKPWLEDFGRYQARHPQIQYLIAQSTQPALSESEAVELAWEHALIIVNHRLNLKTTADTQPLTIEDLQRCNIPIDQFSQSFQRDYSKIYRHLILLELSPGKIQQFRDLHAHRAALERQSILRQIFSLAGMVLLIFLVYLFLNAATRGYYVWMLRIVAVLAAAGGGLLLIWYLN